MDSAHGLCLGRCRLSAQITTAWRGAASSTPAPLGLLPAAAGKEAARERQPKEGEERRACAGCGRRERSGVWARAPAGGRRGVARQPKGGEERCTCAGGGRQERSGVPVRAPARGRRGAARALRQRPARNERRVGAGTGRREERSGARARAVGGEKGAARGRRPRGAGENRDALRVHTLSRGAPRPHRFATYLITHANHRLPHPPPMPRRRIRWITR
uniref:Uncharacterized protein n=1 Tax=Oryza nivara TaxID=4536 RepID=A0A679BA96_ORYNI|nr:hypothetical protein [Oryza sativa f. spontanea]